MTAMASQITSLTIVYSIVYSGAIRVQIKENIKAPRHWTGDSPHKGPVTRKMFPFDDVIMCYGLGGRHQAITWVNVDLSSVMLRDIHLTSMWQRAPASNLYNGFKKIYI